MKCLPRVMSLLDWNFGSVEDDCPWLQDSFAELYVDLIAEYQDMLEERFHGVATDYPNFVQHIINCMKETRYLTNQHAQKHTDRR